VAIADNKINQKELTSSSSFNFLFGRILPKK